MIYDKKCFFILKCEAFFCVSEAERSVYCYGLYRRNTPRWLLLITLTSVVLIRFVPPIFAEEFIPRVHETKSYKDALFGLQETRENIETVQCGGWNENSEGTVILRGSEHTCRPVITCIPGSRSCDGGGGFTFPKRPNGDVPVCLSSADANNYLLLHELIHVTQFCTKPPGAPLATTQSECCRVEREAYSAQCSAIGADGLLANPINGIALTVAGCIGAGSDFSCRGYGPSACSGQTYPPGYIDALAAAMGLAPARSCQEIINNPAPRVVKQLDVIRRLSRAADGTVAGNVPIPIISPDVPGRSNINPLGDAASGVGKRGPFEYPDSAFGYSSACDVNGVVNENFEVVDETLKRHNIPGIRWEWDGNFDSDVQFVPNDPGVFQVNWGGPKYGAHDSWCMLKNDVKTATPRICQKLKDTLSRMAAVAMHPLDNEYCKFPEPGSDLNPDSLPVVGYPTLIPKRLCFDPLYTLECSGKSGDTPDPVYSYDPYTPSSTTCRSPWYPDISNEMFECHPEERVDADGNRFLQMIIDVAGYHKALSTSFYRHYAGAFGNWEETKDPAKSMLQVTTPDGSQLWKLRAECYEYYANPITHEEEDPKGRVMGREREQCEVIILTDNEQNPRKPAWDDTESGKQKDTIKAEPDAVREPIRPSRVVPDLWVADSDSNLSIVNTSLLKHMQRSLDDPLDITSIMSTILPTRMRASGTVPSHARTDTLSDDAERAFGKFFEAQQKELQKMVKDPVTRVIMPAKFLLGLAPDDPMYQYVKNVVSRSDGTVAATLRSGSEDLMNVMTSLLRAYIAPIQEVRIPVLIPLASSVEISRLIFLWKQWQETEKRFAAEVGRPSNDALADPIIQKLEMYLTRLPEARKLRGAQAIYVKNLFETQKKIRTYTATWFENNSVRLKNTALRGVQRRELRQLWRDVQETMLKADESQLRWCSNQRYSLAVYSLLDLPEVWCGDLPPYALRDPNCLPLDLRDSNYEQPPDAEYDFSDMKFSREPLLIPKLVFVPADIKLPYPPLPGAKPVVASGSLSLPPLPSADIFASLPVPDVTLPEESLVEVPAPTDDLAPALEILGSFHERMQKMYAAYSRFQPSFMTPPSNTQMSGSVVKIIHVENDLKERIARAFSRWHPERMEDYAGRALRLEEEGFRDASGKCHEDVVCYFLPPEEVTTVSWQWSVPRTDRAPLTNKATEIRELSLPPADATEDRNPFTASLPTLRRLFPDVNLPVLIDLSIPLAPLPVP